MSFWDNVFAPQPGQQAPSSPQAQPRAWWQDQPQQTLGQQSAPRMGNQYAQDQYSEEREVKAIRKRGHQQISAEEADRIARFDLENKARYAGHCPECDSGNYLAAGTRVKVPGVTVMPTDKCFDCGYSYRGPEPVKGGGSGQGSIHTRQIDTGGAAGSMFGVFNGVPRTYMPRNV